MKMKLAGVVVVLLALWWCYRWMDREDAAWLVRDQQHVQDCKNLGG